MPAASDGVPTRQRGRALAPGRGRRIGMCVALVRAAALVLLAGLALNVSAAHAEGPPPVEPPDYRLDNYRSPVPLTLRGAKALNGDEAADLWNANGATFIDVYPQAPKPANLPAGTFWRDPVHRSIEGAHWLPNVGYGALSAKVNDYFRTRLDRLTGGNRDAPIVFFCLRDCWMSWNAAKRALELGYSNVMWFRDGTDAWQELGYPLVNVAKDP